jgi:hypothetical protein
VARSEWLQTFARGRPATYPEAAREAVHQLRELAEALAVPERRASALAELRALAEVFSIPRDKLERARERLLAFAARLH